MEKKRKIKLGRVVNNKMDKTVVVAMDTPKHHPLYRKTIKRVVKFKAHDKNNECQLGDIVKIAEIRSSSQRWKKIT